VAQGYRISKPVMAAELPGWVAAQRAGEGYAKIDVRVAGLSTQP
jgi:hypothetical protein